VLRATAREGCGVKMRESVCTALAVAMTTGFEAGGMICGD
jgi:hypothetical protein